jgi:hypothetical protein
VKLDDACIRSLKLTCSAFQRLLIHMILTTITLAMAIQIQHSCGVSGLPENCFFDGWKPGNGFRTWCGL